MLIPKGSLVHTLKGDYFTIILPSGNEINVEITEDTVDIVKKDRTLYCEEIIQGSWEQTYPHPE